MHVLFILISQIFSWCQINKYTLLLFGSEMIPSPFPDHVLQHNSAAILKVVEPTEN